MFLCQPVKPIVLLGLMVIVNVWELYYLVLTDIAVHYNVMGTKQWQISSQNLNYNGLLIIMLVVKSSSVYYYCIAYHMLCSFPVARQRFVEISWKM